jgi:hypothetical protein
MEHREILTPVHIPYLLIIPYFILAGKATHALVRFSRHSKNGDLSVAENRRQFVREREIASLRIAMVTSSSRLGDSFSNYFWALVGAVGIEPTTFGLKGRCSTTELRPYGVNFKL